MSENSWQEVAKGGELELKREVGKGLSTPSPWCFFPGNGKEWKRYGYHHANYSHKE